MYDERLEDNTHIHRESKRELIPSIGSYDGVDYIYNPNL